MGCCYRDPKDSRLANQAQAATEKVKPPTDQPQPDGAAVDWAIDEKDFELFEARWWSLAIMGNDF